MFRDQQRALGNIEHLPLLDPDRRLRIERRTAMPARAGLVANHIVGIGHLPQRAALVALLAPLGLPERLRRLPAIRGFLPNPSLEGGLELFELSRPKRRRRSPTSARSANISALSEAIKSSTSAGSVIPPLIQIRAAMSPKTRSAKQIHQACGFSDSHRLGSYLPEMIRTIRIVSVRHQKAPIQ